MKSFCGSTISRTFGSDLKSYYGMFCSSLGEKESFISSFDYFKDKSSLPLLEEESSKENCLNDVSCNLIFPIKPSGCYNPVFAGEIILIRSFNFLLEVNNCY